MRRSTHVSTCRPPGVFVKGTVECVPKKCSFNGRYTPMMICCLMNLNCESMMIPSYMFRASVYVYVYIYIYTTYSGGIQQQ